MFRKSSLVPLLSFILILLSCNASFSQDDINKLHEFNFFKNLFFVGEKAYTIETLKEVTTEVKPGYVKILNNASVLGVHVQGTWANNKVLFYDRKNQKIGDIVLDRNQLLSPDFDYVLSIKDRDYQVQKIENYKALGVEKQLTNLGAFERIQYAQWFGKSIYPVINWQGEIYILNAEIGEIVKAIDVPTKQLANYENPAKEVSPGGRYIIGSKDFFSFYVHDSKTGTSNSFPKKFDERLNFEAPVWISDKEFLMLGILMGRPSIINAYRFQLTDGNKIQLVAEFKNLNVVGTKSLQQFSLVDKFRGRSRCISLDSQYMITPRTRPNDYLLDIALVDLTNGTVEIVFENNSSNVLNQNSILDTSRNPMFRWISPKTIIYVTKGDLLSQGTWVFDIESRKQKKVSPLVGEEFWVFEEAGYVLFRANGKLFRSDSAGDNLTEMTGVNLNGKIEKLIE